MGIRLKNARKQKNMSINGLAKETGLSPTYLSNLENDNRCNPSKETMDKIAEALNSTVPELFYDTEVNKNS